MKSATPNSGWVMLFIVLGLVGVADAAQVLFSDGFAGRLAAGWQWEREAPKHWRLRDGALEIRVEPGLAPTVKNALVRAVPERAGRKLAFEVTVTFTTPPTNQYEQAGLTWYADGKPVFKLVHELVDGVICIVPGKVPTTTQTVELRLVVAANKYEAQFREPGQPAFRTVGTGDVPAAQREEISLQCYHGPEEAAHWMRFDDFRITALAD